MKKNILIYTLLASLFFVGCKKDDGAIAEADGVTLDRVPLVSITKVAGFTADIIPSTIASYVGKIKVAPLYTSDKLPEKVDLVIIKNGVKSSVKVLKAGITVPTDEVSFTGADLIAAFGPVLTCDAFQIGVDIYFNGKKYEAYPAGGVGNGGATDANQPGYSVLLNYSTKIEYNPDIYDGNFAVVSDGWADMSAGDVVKLTKIDATHFSFKYNPSPEQGPTGSLYNAKPIIVTVDPATLVTSVASQNAGSGWTYDNSVPVTVVSQAGANNFVTAVCTKTAARVSLSLKWTQGSGTYGPYTFVLKGL